MKREEDYINDLSEIRSMMERSSKFLSVSGLSGIFAGIYALIGAYVAYAVFDFNPQQIQDDRFVAANFSLMKIIALALGVMILSVATLLLLFYKKSLKRQERFWTPTAKLFALNITVPLLAGGCLILILLANGLIGLMAPATLLFYGLGLFSVSNFTYNEIRSLGLIQIVLGLLGAYFIEYSVLLWAIGFGGGHIGYGIYLYYRYER